MEREMKKFYNNLTNIKKDIVAYEDEKGNYFLIPIGKLTSACEYRELDEAQMKVALFNKEIEKNKKYNKIKIIRQVDKFSLTNNKKDQGVIIDKEVEVYQVWLVKNGLGLVKSFSSKEKAVNYSKEINKKTLEMIDEKGE